MTSLSLNTVCFFTVSNNGGSSTSTTPFYLVCGRTYLMYAPLIKTHLWLTFCSHRQNFELWCIYCRKFDAPTTITFLTGFYVTNVVSRWWDQFMALPWPDQLALKLVAYMPGKVMIYSMINPTSKLVITFQPHFRMHSTKTSDAPSCVTWTCQIFLSCDKSPSRLRGSSQTIRPFWMLNYWGHPKRCG